MTEFPDTTTTSDPSHDAPGEHGDDAAGYYTPGEPIADTKAPGGPISERWSTRKFEARLAGLTSRASNLRVLQRSLIGPPGALVSAMGSPGV